MDRRRILLVVAVLVAAVGSALVFLYTKGADTRAEEKFDTVEVLEATAVIAPGETFEDAQAAGKLALQAVSKDALLDGYQTTTDSLTGTVSLGTIYPGEQIISAKWGATAAVQSSPSRSRTPTMAVSVNLTDPARVAGFVNPGSQVAIFLTGTDQARRHAVHPAPARPGHRPRRRLDHAGVDHHDGRDGRLDDRAAAPHAPDHSRLEPAAGREGRSTRQGNGELAFGLLTDKSARRARRRTHDLRPNLFK